MKQPEITAAAQLFPSGFCVIGVHRPRPRPSRTPQCDFCVAHPDGKFPCGDGGGDEYHVEGVRGALCLPAEPLVVVVALRRGSYTRRMIADTGKFAVSLLREDQPELAQRFGQPTGRNVEHQIGDTFRVGPTGTPVLRDCAAWLDCHRVQEMETEAGYLVLGRALDGGIGNA